MMEHHSAHTLCMLKWRNMSWHTEHPELDQDSLIRCHRRLSAAQTGDLQSSGTEYIPSSPLKQLCFMNWQHDVTSESKREVAMPVATGNSQTLFHLTKFWGLGIIVPQVGLCSKAPHLEYSLPLSLPDQNLLGETNHQMERFLATSSKRIG